MFGGSTDSAVTVQSSEDRKALKQPLLQKEQEEEESAQEEQLFQLVALEQTPTSRTSITIHRQIRSMDEIDVINAKSELQQAFLEFHHCVWLIHNFATLNQQAFQYFVDLHDSQIARDSDPSDFMLDLKACSFYAQVKTCDLLRKEIEVREFIASSDPKNRFTYHDLEARLCFGVYYRQQEHREKRVVHSRQRLRHADHQSVAGTISDFHVDWIDSAARRHVSQYVHSSNVTHTHIYTNNHLMAVLSSDHDALKSHRAHWIGYRILGLCCLFLWGWGIDVYLWTKYKVNYVFIFDFNPRRHHRYSSIFEVYICGYVFIPRVLIGPFTQAATLFSVLLVISVLLFLFTMTPSPPPGFEWMRKIPAFMHPLTAIIIFLGTFIVFQFKSQFWLLRCLFHVIIAPLTKVKFAHFFMADQLMSLSLVLNDISYFACYLVYDAGRHENGQCSCVTYESVLLTLLLSRDHVHRQQPLGVAVVGVVAAIRKSTVSNGIDKLNS
jgi:hypothetical protein